MSQVSSDIPMVCAGNEEKHLPGQLEENFLQFLRSHVSKMYWPHEIEGSLSNDLNQSLEE